MDRASFPEGPVPIAVPVETITCRLRTLHRIHAIAPDMPSWARVRLAEFVGDPATPVEALLTCATSLDDAATRSETSRAVMTAAALRGLADLVRGRAADREGVT